VVTVGKESRAGWAWYLVANGIGVGVYYLFAGSMALMLAGDIVYAVQEATGTWVDNSWPDPHLDRLLRLLGAAAPHPSMGRIDRSLTVPPPEAGPARLAGLAGAALLAPAVLYGRTAMAVLIADVDHFKSINDPHGHLAGDRILRELASRLRTGRRPGDVLARYGGEEFAVLLPDTDAGRMNVYCGRSVQLERRRRTSPGEPGLDGHLARQGQDVLGVPVAVVPAERELPAGFELYADLRGRAAPVAALHEFGHDVGHRTRHEGLGHGGLLGLQRGG